MDTTLIILLVAACVIIAVLAFYAGSLLTKLWQQNKLIKQGIEKRNDHAIESIKTIAFAVLEEQCDLSEGSIRLSVLLDHVMVSGENSFRTRYPAIHELYDKIKHMPTHDARNELSKQERHRLDMQRWQYEAELKPAILKEVTQLKDFTV